MLVLHYFYFSFANFVVLFLVWKSRGTALAATNETRCWSWRVFFFFRMFILFVFPLCRICKKYNSNNEEISPQTKWNLNCCGGGRNGMAYQRPANATGWRWKSDFPHAGSLITLEHTHTQHADNESRHLHRITALGAQHCNSASADRNFDSTSFCFFLFRETSWARIEANLIKTWFNQCTKN